MAASFDIRDIKMTLELVAKQGDQAGLLLARCGFIDVATRSENAR